MKTTVTILTGTVLLAFAACGDKNPPQTQAQPDAQKPASAQNPSSHGASTNLGTMTIGTRQFEVVRLGDLVPGQEGAFEVVPKGMPTTELATLNAYLWVESQDGTQLSAPEKGSPEGSKLHFHATPKKGDKAPFRVVLRLRANGTDESGSLPLDGHGHEHAHGPHSGVPARFQGAGTAGQLELKLHDDEGDLELWLYADDKLTQPFDLPLDTTIEVEFVDHKGKKVVLRPRNAAKNQGEDGKTNVRDGKTNYFIFPGETGEDASWLRSKEFQSIVIVRWKHDQAAIASEELMLKPHVH